jgi:hypothetical protein
MTSPVTAPVGTVTVRLVVVAPVTLAVTPPIMTVSPLTVALNPVPVIVTLLPTSPDVGVKLVIVGAVPVPVPVLEFVVTV